MSKFLPHIKNDIMPPTPQLNPVDLQVGYDPLFKVYENIENCMKQIDINTEQIAENKRKINEMYDKMITVDYINALMKSMKQEIEIYMTQQTPRVNTDTKKLSELEEGIKRLSTKLDEFSSKKIHVEVIDKSASPARSSSPVPRLNLEKQRRPTLSKPS
jgi:hypothetical protein